VICTYLRERAASVAQGGGGGGGAGRRAPPTPGRGPPPRGGGGRWSGADAEQSRARASSVPGLLGTRIGSAALKEAEGESESEQ
jgi:hypothetical protein